MTTDDDVPYVPAHDYDDPMSLLNAYEAASLLARVRAKGCRHCTPVARLLPMPGNGVGVEWEHERGCPDRIEDDDLPAVGPHYDINGQLIEDHDATEG